MTPTGPRGRLSSFSDYNGIFSCLSSSIRDRSTGDLICDCASPGYQITTCLLNQINALKSGIWWHIYITINGKNYSQAASRRWHIRDATQPQHISEEIILKLYRCTYTISYTISVCCQLRKVAKLWQSVSASWFDFATERIVVIRGS